MKAAAKEFSGVRVKNIDSIRKSIPSPLRQHHAELMADAPEVEVGFNAFGRWTLALREQVSPVRRPAGPRPSIGRAGHWRGVWNYGRSLQSPGPRRIRPR